MLTHVLVRVCVVQLSRQALPSALPAHIESMHPRQLRALTESFHQPLKSWRRSELRYVTVCAVDVFPSGC